MNKSYSAVINNRHFRNLWFGQITSQIALNMLSFVLAIQVYQQTKSNTAVSLMLLTFGIPSIIFGVIAGGVVDHFDKRDVLLFCNIVRIILFLAFFYFAKILLMLYILNILISIITQLFIPSETPLIPRLVNKKYLLSANSLFTISFFLSTLTGFIIAGPALKFFGYRNVYLFMAFIMLLSSMFIYFLPKIKRRGKIKELSFSSIGETIDQGIRFIQGHVRIKQSLLLMTFAQALIATLAVLAPGFADRVLAIDLMDSSYQVLGPAAIGLVLGALWVGEYGQRHLKGTIILLGIIATGVNLTLLSLVGYLINSFVVSLILLFLLGLFNSFITVPANTILQQETNGEVRGRVYGVLTSLTGGVSVLPVIFSGIMADYIGVARALLIIGIIVLITGWYHHLQRRRAAIKIS